jgi:hypothetical protein
VKNLEFLTTHPGNDHFVLIYELRGAGTLSHHGIRDPKLADTYRDAIERALAFLIGDLKLPAPSAKVPVYVFEIGRFFPGENSPFTDSGEDRNPYVALPCRHEMPTPEEEYRHAAACASHEIFHAVAWKRRSLRALISQPWRWFHEGCAVWTEMQALPGNIDYLRYALDWCDHPELPLDDEMMLYQSGFFVRYLAAHFPGLIGRIWMYEDPNLTPLDILARETSWAELFSDYCRDAFLPDFAPDVFRRFGERAIEDEFDLPHSSRVQKRGILNHLSCRYFVVRSDQSPALKVNSAEPGVKIQLASIPSDHNRWVVVVSNSGRGTHNDGLPFEFEVESG